MVSHQGFIYLLKNTVKNNLVKYYYNFKEVFCCCCGKAEFPQLLLQCHMINQIMYMHIEHVYMKCSFAKTNNSIKLQLGYFD